MIMMMIHTFINVIIITEHVVYLLYHKNMCNSFHQIHQYLKTFIR